MIWNDAIAIVELKQCANALLKHLFMFDRKYNFLINKQWQQQQQQQTQKHFIRIK